MKVSAFAQVGYRTFPEDFEQHHDSSVDTPWRLADPHEVRAAFRDYLDGLMLAARSGFDGVVFTVGEPAGRACWRLVLAGLGSISCFGGSGSTGVATVGTSGVPSVTAAGSAWASRIPPSACASRSSTNRNCSSKSTRRKPPAQPRPMAARQDSRARCNPRSRFTCTASSRPMFRGSTATTGCRSSSRRCAGRSKDKA